MDKVVSAPLLLVLLPPLLLLLSSRQLSLKPEGGVVEGSKCPNCYGSSLCSEFEAGNFELQGLWRFSLTNWLLNAKNVFPATWKGRKMRVLVKKLGHDWELEQLDRTLCQLAEEPGSCQVVADKVMKGDSFDISLLRAEMGDKLPDLLQCPDGQDVLDYVLRAQYDSDETPAVTDANILTLILLNTEPLLAKAFSRFPFWPRYLGACGRAAVFKDAGESLSSYMSSPWSLRAKLALSLIRMAVELTETGEGLALYPTDWAAENFAVDRKTLQVVLVDLENVMVVNRSRLAAEGRNGQHVSDNWGCRTCFSFSPPSLCSHASSDHNYHALCGVLLADTPYSSLAGGLLHSPPDEVDRKSPHLQDLLKSCWNSSKSGARQRALSGLEEELKKYGGEEDCR